MEMIELLLAHKWFALRTETNSVRRGCDAFRWTHPLITEAENAVRVRVASVPISASDMHTGVRSVHASL